MALMTATMDGCVPVRRGKFRCACVKVSKSCGRLPTKKEYAAIYIYGIRMPVMTTKMSLMELKRLVSSMKRNAAASRKLMYSVEFHQGKKVKVYTELAKEYAKPF